MKPGQYRELATEIVYKWQNQIYDDIPEEASNGFELAIRMVLDIMRDKEIEEVKNFYDFPKVFRKKD